MIKRLKEEPYEIFLENSQGNEEEALEEEALWISGRASLEAIVENEGLSIFSLIDKDFFNRFPRNLSTNKYANVKDCENE